MWRRSLRGGCVREPRWEQGNYLRRPAYRGKRTVRKRPQVETVDLPGISCHAATVGPSPPQLRHLFQPPQLVRVADRVDAGDPAVLDHEGDRRVELAGRVDPGRDRAVEQ